MDAWQVDWTKPWFNGSDQRFDVLRPGSTITQWQALSEAFSHQPTALWIDDDDRIGHNGRRPGYLYIIDEPIQPDDLEPVPHSTMAPGLEWKTRRPLRVRMVAVLPSTDSEVNAVLTQLWSGARRALGANFIGMYLYGSLALGDFDPRSSDIDFAVVTEGELTGDQVAAIRQLHADIAAAHPHWALELEGSYIPRRDLHRYDPQHATHLHVYQGQVFMEEHGVHWVIERWVLREHGLVLAGPAPAALIGPITPYDLRRAAAELIRSWWVPMLDDPARLQDPQYQAYAVLTMYRILYTLEHGTVVSKPVAARWAREALGVEEAGDPLQRTLDLIRYTVRLSEKSEARRD